MEKEQANTPKQEHQSAGEPEKPSPVTPGPTTEQKPQNGTVAGETHSEGSTPQNDGETLGTP